jgi:hypothetical protein
MRDDDLSRLLGAVRADAEPALWTRARARIEAGGRAGVRGWRAWVMRPAALGASLAVFAGAVAVSAALVSTAPRALTDGSYDTLTEALVADLSGATTATVAAPATQAPAAAPASQAPAAAPAATPDSGGAR